MTAKQLAARSLAPVARWLTQRSARVLMYHRFAHDHTPRRLAKDLFEQQIRYIKRYTNPCRLDTLVDQLKRGDTLVDAPVVVTVDDGYVDFLEIAYPILQRYEIPATVFVVTRFADQAMWQWFDALRYAVDRAAPGHYEIDAFGAPIRITLNRTGPRAKPWERLADLCLCVAPPERDAVVAHVASVLDVSLPPMPVDEYRSMTWTELRGLDSNLIEIGAHTCTHTTLSKERRLDAEAEVRESKAIIERQLGRPVNSFCYPDGTPSAYNDGVVAAVARAGYSCGVVAHGGLVTQGMSLLTLERIGVPDDMNQFRALVDGSSHLLGRAKRLGQPFWKS